MTGIVRDNTGAPLAGVSVKAVSPSQTAAATTDAGGHFVLLSLTPDTYTLSLEQVRVSEHIGRRAPSSLPIKRKRSVIR